MISVDSNHSLVMRTNSTPWVKITASGNVGIGTLSPDQVLTLPSNKKLGWQYAPGTPSYITMEGANGATLAFKTFATTTDTNDNYLFYGSATSGNADRILLALKNSGNVLIGTVTDNGSGAKLQVSGNISFSGGPNIIPASNYDIAFAYYSNTQIQVKMRGSDGVVRTGIMNIA
jgi:hypothetical protein